jgi:hypothetical protein
MPIGPPPTGAGDVRFALYNPAALGLDPRYSDDSGNTYRQAADFTSSFGAVADSLVTVATVGTPFSYQRVGQRYQAALAPLGPLVNEVDNVRSAEPDTVLDALRQNLVDFGLATNLVANELLAGTPNNPTPFYQLSTALSGMATHVQTLDTSQRYAHAARELNTAAMVSQQAAQLVQAGLPDTGSVAMFQYATVTAVSEFLRAFSSAMAPHVLVDVGTCDYAWYPSSTDGAFVSVTDGVGAPLDSIPLEVTDKGGVYIPAMGYTDGQALNVHLKLPSFLSVEWNIPSFTDALQVGPLLLVGGDANNDDCIDNSDLLQVSADFGKGGFAAAQRPPISDVNGDGVVDSLDIKLVQKNMGNCGPATVSVRPPSLSAGIGLAAYPNPFVGSATIRFALSRAAVVTVSIYDVHGRGAQFLVSKQAYAAGTYSIGVHEGRLHPGVYFVRMQAHDDLGQTYDRVVRMTVVR